jgi:probable HAF family extracellular repeat protein
MTTVRPVHQRRAGTGHLHRPCHLLFTALSALSSVLLTWFSTAPALAASFRGLGDLPGGDFFSVAMAVSAEGGVVVGYAKSSNGTEAFRWTTADGMVGLGDLPGGMFSSSAHAVSADGSVVVGDGRSASGNEAFRWAQAAGMVGLGDLPGGSFGSSARGVSADGQVVVGFGYSALSGTRDEAFRWTATNGVMALGDLAGGNYSSRAWAVSADGSVIVGESGSSNATSGVSEAFRWTAATGMVPLGDFPSDVFNSIAYAVSADSSVAVGRGYSGAYDSYTHEAFRWTAASGLVRLGFIPCNDWSIAHAASADGSIIVGDPETNQGDCAFLWDSQHGMRNLHAVLTNDYGLDLPGWRLSGARGITPDGQIIVGFGFNPAGQCEAWIANLKPLRLTISREVDKVVLSWETNAPGFVLVHTPSLASTSAWSAVTAPITVVGEQCVVTNSGANSPSFFRLRKP